MPTRLLQATAGSGNRRLRISVLRCRGGLGGRSVEVELDEETYCVHPVAGKRLQIGERQLQGAYLSEVQRNLRQLAEILRFAQN